MRYLLVTRGFPPEGKWGSEGYAADLAKNLARQGHEVFVFFPLLGQLGELRKREVEPGLHVIALPLLRRTGKPFRDSYNDPRQDRAFDALCRDLGPFDSIHFLALGGEVSITMLHGARKASKVLEVTLTEFLPLCHRGQFLNAQVKECKGPEPSRCAACIMDPGPYEGNPLSAHFKSWIARLGWPLGSLSALPTPAAFRLREKVVQESLDLVDHFYAPSPGLRNRYVEFGIPKEKIFDRPYELDPDRYADYSPVPSADGRVRVAFIGQIAPHKGPQILIQALSLLSEEERTKILLRMHGGPPGYGHASFLPAIQEIVRREHLPVEFPGSFSPDQVARVLSQADCVVIPSLWMENHPLVLIHARSVNLPVLASDTMGIRPFIEDDPQCKLIPPGDPEAWAEALRKLLVREPLQV